MVASSSNLSTFTKFGCKGTHFRGNGKAPTPIFPFAIGFLYAYRVFQPTPIADTFHQSSISSTSLRSAVSSSSYVMPHTPAYSDTINRLVFHSKQHFQCAKLTLFPETTPTTPHFLPHRHKKHKKSPSPFRGGSGWGFRGAASGVRLPIPSQVVSDTPLRGGLRQNRNGYHQRSTCCTRHRHDSKSHTNRSPSCHH